MGKAAGQANCCLAQMVLHKEGLTEISPKELGDMIEVSPTAAAHILRDLSWERELGCRAGERAIYRSVGLVKDFSIGARSRAKLNKQIKNKRQGEVWRRFFSLEVLA